jgi:xanthine dehydrogenase accessory factor
MKECQEILRAFRKRRGESFALATLVRARGSSYRRPGARMLIDRHAVRVGSLSGGCLEEEVAILAQDVIQKGKPMVVPFDMRRRFGCNGQIQILIELLNKSFLVDLSEHFEARRSCIVSTNFENAAYKLGTKIVGVGEETIAGAFEQRIDPPIQLVIVGGGHDSIPFRSFCDLLGWCLFEIENIFELPQNLDTWSAALVKTHNYGRDFAALKKLLPLGLRYVGLIGPRRRRDQLLADLFDTIGPIDAELFAPAGLDLGAETPEEIALAIVAEIQSVFAAASSESLRNRKAPIHAINYSSLARSKSFTITR